VAAVRDLKSFIIFQKGGSLVLPISACRCPPSYSLPACRHIGGSNGNPAVTQVDADIARTARGSGDSEAFRFISSDLVNLFI
jgi:hypothetical protein